MSASNDTRTGRLRIVRALSVVVIVAAVAALVAVSLSSAAPIKKHITVLTRIHQGGRSVASAVQSPSVTSPSEALPSPTAAASASSDPAPLATSSSPVAAQPVASASPVSATGSGSGGTGSGSTASTGTGGAAPGPTPSDLPACPVSSLPTPADPGGLQSLVGFAPLFGPFSSEAFAGAPLFQPFLEAIGPFLQAFANAYAPYAADFAPFFAQIEALENSGYGVLAPLYGPYRSQFLSAESALATALSPVIKALAANPGTSCLVDIEAELVGG
jgi:hypothetical protein